MDIINRELGEEFEETRFVPLIHSPCYCTCVLLQIAGLHNSELIAVKDILEEVLVNDHKNLNLLAVFLGEHSKCLLTNSLFLYEQIGIIRKSGEKNGS